MPVSYVPTGSGNRFSIPDYPEAADGPKAFRDYSDLLQLLLPPVGSVVPHVGDTAPSGPWLPCNGGEFDTATYPRLAALCGTKFGTAAAGKFKVPDLRGRTIVGLNSADADFSTVGKTGGSATFTLTQGNIPAHDHTINHTLTTASGGDHTHAISIAGTTGSAGSHSHASGFRVAENFTRTASSKGAIDSAAAQAVRTSDSGAHTHPFTVSGATASGGGHVHTIDGNITVVNAGTPGTAVKHQMPFTTLNYMIRADL